MLLTSERADTDMYRLSADISVIGRYIDYRPIIGFADKQNPYWYRLSVSADNQPYIGDHTDMLNYMWP